MAGGLPPKKSKTGLVAAIAAVLALVVGLLAGPRLPFIPSPTGGQIAEQQAKIDELNKTISNMKTAAGPSGKPVSQEEISKMAEEQAKIAAEIAELTSPKDAAAAEVTNLTTQRDAVSAELESKNAEFVKAQSEFDELQNQTAITQARRDGLVAETERLEGQVGKLDEANTRSMMTKETLESNIARLMVTVQEGSPLTPDKYSRQDRIARVQGLKDRASAANWVDPALLDEYTALYLAELEISQSREYFFAKLPVVDRFGTKTNSWAECVMNGNHGVYYRTLDGLHTGVYQNTAAEGPAKYSFTDMAVDSPAAKEIEAEVFAARTPGYEQKIELLAQKQLVVDDKSDLQKKFDSL